MSASASTTEAEELRALAQALNASDFAAVRLAFACGGTTRSVRESLLRPSFICSSAVASRGPDESSKSAGVEVRDGQLVGFISADGEGGLFLCDVNGPAAAAIGAASGFLSSPALMGEARLVVAPPLSPCFRNALVYVRDWRRLPPTSTSRSKTQGCPGVYEVLRSDILVLSNGAARGSDGENPVSAMRFVPLRELEPEPLTVVNVRCRVRCKSNVIASRTCPVFLVELGSCSGHGEEDVIVSVFHGHEAVSWWPFITCGEDFYFAGLSFASLPTRGHRRILRARGPGVRIMAVDPISDVSIGPGHETGKDLSAAGLEARCSGGASAPPLKRSRVKIRDVHTPSVGPCVKSSRRRLVSFRGEITEVKTDGRFVLDNSIMLHLGSYGGWCAGPEEVSSCFRKGAQIIVVEALVAWRRGRAVALFPTARSDAHIVYFGPLPSPASGLKAQRSFRDSPWRSLWKELSSSQVLWAEELYRSLSEKFGSWCNSQIEASGDARTGECSSDYRTVETLLGSKTEDGLVRHIMKLHPKLRLGMEPPAKARDVYKEFMCLSDSGFPYDSVMDRGDYALVPSITQIIQAGRCLYNLSQTRLAETTTHDRTGADSQGLESSALAYFARLSSDVARIIIHGDAAVETLGSELSSSIDLQFVEDARREQDVDAARSSLTFPLDKDSIALQSGSDLNWRDGATDLIACLDSTIDSRGGLCVFDATGYLYAFPMGSLSPRFLGAVVRIPFFAVLRVSDEHCGVTWCVIFDASAVQAVISRDCEPMMSKALSMVPAESQYVIQREDGRPPAILPSQRLATTLNASDKVPDERPVVAIYVTEVMLQTVCEGLPSFRVRGRLLATRPSRSNQFWCYLGDGKRGFLECMLCVSGGLATPLYSMIQCKRVYEITCTDLTEVLDVMSFVWQRALAPTESEGESRNNLTVRQVHLSTMDENCRIWLYPRDVAELVSLDETEEEQSVVEAAVETWQAGGGIAHSQESPVLDVSVVFSERSLGHMSSRIRLKGVFTKAFLRKGMQLQASQDSECAAIGTFTLRDVFLPLAEAKITLDNDLILPAGLLPGTVIEVSGVRLSIARNGSDVELAIERSSSVRILCESLLSLGARWPSLCCQRPVISGSVLSALPSMYLRGFTQSGCGFLGNPQLMGCVSLSIKRVTFVRLFARRVANPLRRPLCSFCMKGEYEMDGEVFADVADGTASGRMVGRGLRIVLETLCASEYDTMLLRRALLVKHLEYQVDACTSAPQDAFATLDESYCSLPYDQGSKVLHRLVHSAPRNVIVVSKASPKDADDGIVNLTGSIDLGRGNKLSTAVHGRSDRASIECVALLENLAWCNSARRSGDAAAAAVDMIRTHLDVLARMG